MAVPIPALLVATAISAGAGYAWYELEYQNMGGHTWLAISTGVAIGIALRRLGARPGHAWWIAIILTVAPLVAAKYQLTYLDGMRYSSEQLSVMQESGALEKIYRAENSLSAELPVVLPEDEYSEWQWRYRERLEDSYSRSSLLLERLGPGEVLLLLLSAGAALFALLQLYLPGEGR